MSMPQIAITRQVSPAMNACELSFHVRQPIDIAKAMAQHRSYETSLTDFGLRLITLPAEPELPDSVFVEDTALVLDELAVIMNMGAASRRPEAATVAKALAPFRQLECLTAPATMDGGDVLLVDRTIFVGLSRRTNREAIEQLRELVSKYGYTVQAIEVAGCLHLKSACSYLGRGNVLVNSSWIDPMPLSEFRLIEVANNEPGGANVLRIGQYLIMPDSFPETKRLLEAAGFALRTVDVSELQKAEAGVTCCSLILNEISPS